MASSIAKFLNWVSPDLQKNDDKQYIGIDGFRMFVAISEGTNFSASAPDIVCEDLTTVQDSIINAPKTFSLTGEVADIFIETTPATGLGTIFEKVLNIATPYLPARTLSQIQKIEEQANGIENIIDSATSFVKNAGGLYDLVGNKSVLANARGAFDSLVGGTGISEDIEGLFNNIIGDKPPKAGIKSEFFTFIERIYDSKKIIKIENKSRVQLQVLITGFSFTETNDGDTGDFTMTFKEIRIASIGLFRDLQNLSDGEKAKIEVNTTLKGQLESKLDKGLSDGIKVVQDKAVQIFNSVGLSNAAGFIGGL